MKSQRLESVELLRCILMFCIVAHHSFHCGIFGDATGWWALFFESLIVWHVDTFIGISGWFGMSFKWRKVIRIVGLMAWTSALSIGYLLVFDRSHLTLKSIGIHGGWFGETYLMFLFVIPFVNAAIQGLEKEPSKKVLFIWGIMAGAYALIWLPGHLLLPFSPSGVSGQSLFLFFFIYVTMRLVKMHADRIVFLKHHILIGGGVFLLISTLCGGVAIFYRWLAGMTIAGRHLSAWSSYAAPHVWLFAICLVYFFATRVHLPMWLARFVSVISPSMFGVYLLHDTTSFGRLLYRVPQSWLDHVGLHPFLCVLLSTLLCFLICLSIDLLRRMILGLIWKRIDHLLPT